MVVRFMSRTRNRRGWRLIRSIHALGLLLVILGIAVVGCGRRQAPSAPSAHEIQEFTSAVNDGDAAIVDRLLSAKPGLVNVRLESGKTAVAVAREKGDSQMEDVLKRHGGHE